MSQGHLPSARCLAALLILAAAPASSQPPEKSERLELEESITVTAEKREERLQDVGVAISVLPSRELEALDVERLSTLSPLVPNVDIKQSFGNTNPVVTIRGVGLNDFNPNNNPSAGVYIDEVFLTSTSMMDGQLFDIERVEILKGPQGTLYGRNTSAGAINLLTRRPSAAFEARLNLGYGNYEASEIDGAIGGALGDRLNGRLAVSSKQSSDGPFKNRFLGENHGEVDVLGLRASLDYQADDNLSARFTARGGRDRSDAFYFEHVGFLDPATFSFCDAVRQGRTDPSSCFDLAGYSDPDGDPFAGDYDLRPELDNDAFGAHVSLDWVGDAFTFTSITAYEAFDRFQTTENDSSPLPGLHNFYDTEIDQFSQELRWTSNRPLKAGSGEADWITGLFYSRDDIVGSQLIVADAWFLTRSLSSWEQDTETAAAFAHLDWHLSESLDLIIGARYTWEQKDFVGNTTDLNPNGTSCLLSPFCNPGFVGPFVLASTDDSLSTNDLSGKVGLEYAANERWLIFGSLSKGFKSGGFNGSFAGSDFELEPFEKEEVYALELGAKGTLGGGTSLNATAFHYDYTDLQVFTIRVGGGGVPSVVLTNASDATITGLELDLSARPTPQLEARVSLGLLDTELKDFESAGTDYSGNQLANAPELTFSGLLRYQWRLGASALTSLAVDWSYQEETFKEVTNNPILQSGDYWLLGARWSYETERWGLAAWARNLTDEIYLADASDQSAIFHTLRIYGMPRTYGVTATLNW